MSEDDEKVIDSEGYQTLAQGVLSPRHRRLAQLAAQGKTNAEIGEELGYVGSRVSALLKNPHIVAEISRLQDRLFEETIAQRLKAMGTKALDNVEGILGDRTNKVKVSEKLAASQWVIEKLDGKAAQKIEAGENLLAVLMDRLDAQKNTRPVVEQHLHLHAAPSTPPPMIEAAPAEDALAGWVTEFCATPKDV